MTTAACWVCHVVFEFDADRVPSIPLTRAFRPAYGIGAGGNPCAPLCRPCVHRANVERVARGLVTWVVDGTAYGRTIGYEARGVHAVTVQS